MPQQTCSRTCQQCIHRSVGQGAGLCWYGKQHAAIPSLVTVHFVGSRCLPAAATSCRCTLLPQSSKVVGHLHVRLSGSLVHPTIHTLVIQAIVSLLLITRVLACDSLCRGCRVAVAQPSDVSRGGGVCPTLSYTHMGSYPCIDIWIQQCSLCWHCQFTYQLVPPQQPIDSIQGIQLTQLSCQFFIHLQSTHLLLIRQQA